MSPGETETETVKQRRKNRKIIREETNMQTNNGLSMFLSVGEKELKSCKRTGRKNKEKEESRK